MDATTFQMLTSIALSVLLLVLIGILITRKVSARTLLFWLGLALLPAGAYFAGLVPYLIDAWNAFATWWQASVPLVPASPAVTAGAVLLGLGLLLLLISRLIPARRRVRETTPAVPATGASAVRSRPVYDTIPTSQTTPADRLP